MLVATAPPPPRYESIPAPRSGEIWVPGFWNWETGRHQWIPGHFQAIRDGYQYQRNEWVRESDGWRLHRGGWRTIGQNDSNSYSDNHGNDSIRSGPPPARYEATPRARPGYIWAPGYWDWRGDRHAWVRGTWLRVRPGHVYYQPRWQQRNGEWYFEQGYWEQTRRARDRERDGDPDRITRRNGAPGAFNNDRNNDGIRDRTVADRDGDGFFNTNDRYPDNPHRH